VLFISSTSVYNDVDAFVTEETIARPATESGKQLLETEQLLQSNINFKTTILRFGGLIGEDRHPVKFLAVAKSRKSNAPINLIHQEDCIGIINAICHNRFGAKLSMLLHRIILLERNITLKGCRIEFGFAQIHH
jgi:nucleoside-diphosphate-sugar epimerase